MKDYFRKILLRHGHPVPTKCKLSPHCDIEISYDSKAQYTTEHAYSPPLDNAIVKRIQEIFGCLLFYERTVENKLPVELSKIGTQQAAATKWTNESVSKFIDYMSTYPNESIIYLTRNMILAAHDEAAYLNFRKVHSNDCASIMISENGPNLRHNGPVLSITQIIKFFMSSEAEAIIVGLLISAKDILPLKQTLSEMGWPQPKNPLQTDNLIAVGSQTIPL